MTNITELCYPSKRDLLFFKFLADSASGGSCQSITEHFVHMRYSRHALFCDNFYMEEAGTGKLYYVNNMRRNYRYVHSDNIRK